MPKKRLMELREARVNRLVDEQKSLERQSKEMQSQNIRSQILAN
jgi:sensor histidine kinase YesM